MPRASGVTIATHYHRDSRLLAFLALLFATLLVPRAARAQAGAGVITGIVVDAAERKPLADVVVTLTSPSLQGEQVMVTDSSGFYRMPDLPPGRYTLRLEADAFKAYSRDGIDLRAD